MNEADATEARRAVQQEQGPDPIVDSSSDDEPNEPTERVGISSDSEVSDDNVTADLEENAVKSALAATAKESATQVELSVDVPAAAWGRVMVEDVVHNTALQSVIRETSGISRCFLERNDADELVVSTEGSNLHAVWEHDDFVRLERVISNDIYLILETYGVEAARAALINELSMVFQAYGIPVNNRHISLIADYMTVNGRYRPFNRIGMNTAPSGLQKMSFETSMKFLTEAALHGDIDQLQSPSARIAVGEVARCGTGMFDLFQRMHI
mmetsp:Transcript_12573/g.38432  ORF Transcript_12573/g.38432 Transcript_12573/m.38432 type:complete len:269 (-) Transcript_12573:1575-2381(-)